MVYSARDGTEYKTKWGTKAQVWDGTSYCTRGFLTREDLTLNTRRKVVSKKKSNVSRVRWEKHGFRKVKVEEEKKEDEKKEEEEKPVTAIQKKLAMLKAKKRKRVRSTPVSKKVK